MPSSSRLSSSDDDEEEKKNSYVPPSAPVGITFDTPIHPLSLTKEKEKDFPRLDTIHTLPPGLPALGQSLSRRQTLAIQTYPSRRGGTAATDFRTLSIQVYESQQPGGGNKKLSGDKEADVDFFSRVNFHLLPAMDVCQQFGVNSEKGLEENSAKNRLERNGRNVLVERKKRYWKKLLKYFFGGFCSILWIGVIIFFISWKPLGNPPAPYNLALAIVVILVILSQALFSAFEDWSTQKVMNSILNLVPENSLVLREGELRTIPSAELVTGDIVQLSTGNKVAADMRIIKASSDLRFDRAVLTGEAEEVPGMVDSTEPVFLEAKNIAFLGTHCTNGNATGVVVLTGGKTVMGRINSLTNNTKEIPTLIQLEITRFIKIIIVLTISLIALMLIIWAAWLRRDHFAYLNVVGIMTNCMGLVVAFIPEGMPVAVALTLSLVARRMKSVNVLPKSLSTVETLGCVNVICSDKTGTLTLNQMTVESVGFQDIDFLATETDKLISDPNHKHALNELQRTSVLCNDAFFEREDTDATLEKRPVNGNATDIAMLRYAESRQSTDDIRSSSKRIFDVPFNSRNKWMMTVHRGERDDYEILVKGAPDGLLPRCTEFLSAKTGETVPLGEDERRKIVAMQERWSRQGQRVLLVCRRSYSPESEDWFSPSNEESIIAEGLQSLTVIGLYGIMDPARADIPHTVSECRRAGSRFFMVTGDFSITAAAIGKKVGIFTGQNEPETVEDLSRRIKEDLTQPDEGEVYIKSGLVLTGSDMLTLTDAQWDIICLFEEIVFARTSPEQKLRIVNEFKDRGYIVAVTGDGVNDAPALKAANVGIAMSGGSDVAMEASDLILLGDFGSIVEGIRLGRLVFQNLQKVISYLLPAGSFSEDWPVLLSVFLGVPLPLSSFLMIIICCFTDLGCCLCLIMETAEFDLLSLAPRRPTKDHLVNLKIYAQAYGFIGVMETVCAHAMFFFYMWKYAGIPASALFLCFENYTDGFYGYTQDELTNFNNTGQCVYFVTLVIMQWGNLLSVRSKKVSLLQANPLWGPRKNLWIPLGMVVALVIAIFVTEEPGMQNLFGTASVPIEFWFLPIPLAVGLMVMDELRKLAVRMWPNGPIARIAW